MLLPSTCATTASEKVSFLICSGITYYKIWQIKHAITLRKSIIRHIVQSLTCLGRFYAALFVFLVSVKSEKYRLNLSLLKKLDYFSLVSSVSSKVRDKTMSILQATLCKHVFSCISDCPG